MTGAFPFQAALEFLSVTSSLVFCSFGVVLFTISLWGGEVLIPFRTVVNCEKREEC